MTHAEIGVSEWGACTVYKKEMQRGRKGSRLTTHGSYQHRRRRLEDRPTLASYPAQLKDEGGGGQNFYCDGSCSKSMPYRLLWQGLLSSELCQLQLLECSICTQPDIITQITNSEHQCAHAVPLVISQAPFVLGEAEDDKQGHFSQSMGRHTSDRRSLPPPLASIIQWPNSTSLDAEKVPFFARISQISARKADFAAKKPTFQLKGYLFKGTQA